MRALRATRQITEPNRADFLQLTRIAPDVEKGLQSHIAAGERELHAGKNIAVWRNVATGMSGATWQGFEVVFIRTTRGGAEFFDISNQSLIPKNLLKSATRLRYAPT